MTKITPEAKKMSPIADTSTTKESAEIKEPKVRKPRATKPKVESVEATVQLGKLIKVEIGLDEHKHIKLKMLLESKNHFFKHVVSGNNYVESSQAVIEVIQRLLNDTNAKRLDAVVNIPVEFEVDEHNNVKNWRVLKEVL